MRNRQRRRKKSLLAFLVAILLLAGCARSMPVSYYQLSALEAAGKAPGSAEAGRMVIGIGPVLLPEYLDRPQLVTRLTANRLHLADSHRWAEPLSKNIPRVMGENLSMLLGTNRILLHPWPLSTTTDYQLFVEVLHFENEGDGAAILVVRWSLKGRDGETVLPTQRSSHRIPAANHSQEGQVAALNEALLSYCREVARELLQSR
jgi:hypothetical protein